MPEPVLLHGRYLNLFDPALAVRHEVTVSAGDRMLLLDLDGVKAKGAKVVAAACRVGEERADGKTLRFKVDGIAGTSAVVAIAARTAPAEVMVGGKALAASQYDFADGVVRLRFANSVEAETVEVRF